MKINEMLRFAFYDKRQHYETGMLTQISFMQSQSEVKTDERF